MIFKYKRDKRMFTTLHPLLIMIYADLFWYVKSKYNIELVVTSTVSNKLTDKLLKRTSNAHSQSRALDIRCKDVDVLILNDAIEYINNKPEYEQYHYLSSSGLRRLAYIHTGTAEHIHLSIHKRYANDSIN